MNAALVSVALATALAVAGCITGEVQRGPNLEDPATRNAFTEPGPIDDGPNPGVNGEDEHLPPSTNGTATPCAHVAQDESDWIVAPSHGSVRITLRNHSCGVLTEVEATREGSAFRVKEEAAGGQGTVAFLEPGAEFKLRWKWVHEGHQFEAEQLVVTGPAPRLRVSPDDALVHAGVKLIRHELVAADANQCTGGFVARGPLNDSLFLITAGHCVDELVGEEVYHPEGPAIGVVVAAREEGMSDWGLIQIHEELQNRTSPGIRGLFGPGSMGQGAVNEDDLVCFMGRSDAFEQVDGLRPRCGHGLGYDAANMLWYHGQHYTGDSGGPIVHMESGEPLGIITAGLGATGLATPICTILDELDEQGFPVKLLSASQGGPLPEVEVPSDFYGAQFPFNQWVDTPLCSERMLARHAG